MIRVLLYGLGPIGTMVARQLATRDGFRIVGAVDVDPAKVGRDVAEIAGLSRPLRVKVDPDASSAIKENQAGRGGVVHVFVGEERLPANRRRAEAQSAHRHHHGRAQLSGEAQRALAKKIDAMAKRAKVAVLSTGVNPGFAMDALPIALTAVCERVDSVTVHRVQDARTRRLPFQQKIGAGLTREQFNREVERGSIRHVGLAESITMIADAMGWQLDRVTDEIKPKIAEATVSSEYLAVDAGYVSGIIQDGVGYRHGTPVVTLHMEAYLGAPESYDTTTIEGTPRLTMTVQGGIPGDIATTSIVVNSIPKVIDAPPGLQTMRHLPLMSYFGGSR